MSFSVIHFSEQPVPQAEARNSVAWRALGKSQAEIMEPTIERWKGARLDAMLVFVCPLNCFASMSISFITFSLRVYHML